MRASQGSDTGVSQTCLAKMLSKTHLTLQLSTHIHSHIYWVGHKVHLGFSVRSYIKIQ